MASEPSPRLKHIASVTPPSSSRAWQTAVHPRLPMLATCNSDKIVNIYSLNNFVQLSNITGGHKRSIRTCAWKPNVANESILATGSFDASVGIWRRDDDDVAGNVGPKAEETDFTKAEGSGDEHEEDEEWRFALVLDGHDSEVKSVAWSAGGNLLATCARDKSVWIWEEVGDDDFETIAVLQEHTADVKTVAWHPEEEMLASGSYDDEIRLWKEDVDDWDCISVLRGHESTVWMVEFEGLRPQLNFQGKELSKEQQAWIARREAAGPRLVSCSDDRTIRIWRRVPREKRTQSTMSIIRTGGIEEEWVQEAQLPVVHSRPIYAVAWSRETGRIVSTGGDGKIAVYEERWNENDARPKEVTADDHKDQTGKHGQADSEKQPTSDGLTHWQVVVDYEGAHGVFEINHVTWTRRTDHGKTYDGEEAIVSTGDDGAVSIWTLNL